MSELKNLGHERFAQEYVTSMLDPRLGLGVPNATQAAIRAGFSNGRANSAKVAACRMLARTDVSDRIAELERQQSQAWQQKRDLLIGSIIEKLWTVAFAGYREIELPDGRVASLEPSDSDPGQLLLNLEFPKESITSRKLRDVVKTRDQLRAYEILLKALDAFGEDDLPPLSGDEPEKMAVDIL